MTKDDKEPLEKVTSQKYRRASTRRSQKPSSYHENADGDNSEFELTVSPSQYSSKEHVYLVAKLLEIGKTEEIPVVDGLPEADFWRQRGNPKKRNEPYGFQQGSASSNFSSTEHEVTGEMGSFSIKHNKNDGPSSYDNKKKGRGKEFKKSGFFGQEFEDEEEDPAWLMDGDDESTTGSVGKTVQDFENWKLRMKLEDKKKDGTITQEEEAILDDVINSRQTAPANLGSGVDDFFGFNQKKKANGSVEPELNEDESAGSSRFSNFFKPVEPTSFDSSHSVPGNGQPNEGNSQDARSRILSMLGKSEPRVEEPPKGSSNDLFFMSLLNKSTGPGSSPNAPPQLSNIMSLFGNGNNSPQTKEAEINSRAKTNPLNEAATENSRQHPQSFPPGFPPMPQNMQNMQNMRLPPGFPPMRNGGPPPNNGQFNEMPPNLGGIPPWLLNGVLTERPSGPSPPGFPPMPMHYGPVPPNMLPPHLSNGPPPNFYNNGGQMQYNAPQLGANRYPQVPQRNK